MLPIFLAKFVNMMMALKDDPTGMVRGQIDVAYRKRYWEKNELQLVLPDAPDAKYVEREIARLDKEMNVLSGALGYVPDC